MNENLNKSQFKDVPWKDHPQTSSLYAAEGDWIKSDSSAGQQLSRRKAQKFMRSITGTKTKVILDSKLSIRDEQGNAIQPLNGMVHEGNLFVNPKIVGKKFSKGDITHEAAHIIDDKDGHGPHLAAKNLYVLKQHLGQEAHDSLLTHYKKNGIKLQ